MNEQVCKGCPHRKTRMCAPVCTENIMLGLFDSKCPVRERDKRIEKLEAGLRRILNAKCTDTFTEAQNVCCELNIEKE